MFENFPSGELKQLVHLQLALRHKQKEKMGRARKRLDMALASTPKPAPFILAFDGLVMVGEDRLDFARTRLSECLRVVKPEESADDDYVAKFCRLWLAISDENVGFDEIKSAAKEQNAAWSQASKLVQIYLPRSPIDALEEICGHRTPKVLDNWQRPSNPPHINTETSLDF
ncbi:hypothetical protein Q9K01_09925 [Qipengyuania sp. DY56-A-20]|uniref:Uncharacterized protein n=1 Tax=Qipengyuania benthica TaxID=3067651 RepID=A0ABT9H9D6_9SPHN|nr:hypothetical protein [Qipengyuania sp. DY56-A-20]MDP4539942.1 hypothetical protein [Qipengyuania sp. DY56-A-20]